MKSSKEQTCHPRALSVMSAKTSAYIYDGWKTSNGINGIGRNSNAGLFDYKTVRKGKSDTSLFEGYNIM